MPLLYFYESPHQHHQGFDMRKMQEPPMGLHLSAEEAAILSDEIEQDAAAVVTTLAIASTASEVSNIYADSKGIERSFDNAEMLAVADMAGAALGQSVTIVDYKPEFPLATEGFADQAANIWKKVVELLKRAWQYLTSLFKRMFSYKGYLRHRISTLREKIAAISDKPLTDKPVINVPMRDGKIFTTQGKKLIDTATFTDVMNGIFTNVKHNFQSGPIAITALGDAFMEGIKMMSPNTTNEALQGVVVDKFLPALWRYFDAFHVKDFKRNSIDSHITNTFTATSPPVVGSCRVEFTWGSAMNQFFLDRQTEEPIAYVLRDLTIAKCQLVQEREQTPSNHLTMPAFKYVGLENALKAVEKGLALIDDLEKAHDSKMHDFSQQFATIAADVSKRFDGQDPANDASMNRSTFNVMLNLPTVYTHLATQPITDLTKRTLGTFEAVLNMVEQSTKMYQPKAA